MAGHRGEVYRTIVALTPSTADAGDVFQETATTPWRQFEKFDPGTGFAAWACEVAYCRVLAHHFLRGLHLRQATVQSDRRGRG